MRGWRLRLASLLRELSVVVEVGWAEARRRGFGGTVQLPAREPPWSPRLGPYRDSEPLGPWSTGDGLGAGLSRPPPPPENVTRVLAWTKKCPFCGHGGGLGGRLDATMCQPGGRANIVTWGITAQAFGVADEAAMERVYRAASPPASITMCRLQGTHLHRKCHQCSVEWVSLPPELVEISDQRVRPRATEGSKASE